MALENELDILTDFVRNPCDTTQDDAREALAKIKTFISKVQTDERYIKRLSDALRTVDGRLLKIQRSGGN